MVERKCRFLILLLLFLLLLLLIWDCFGGSHPISGACTATYGTGVWGYSRRTDIKLFVIHYYTVGEKENLSYQPLALNKMIKKTPPYSTIYPINSYSTPPATLQTQVFLCGCHPHPLWTQWCPSTSMYQIAFIFSDHKHKNPLNIFFSFSDPLKYFTYLSVMVCLHLLSNLLH